jgi:hypothetical protein
MSIESVKEEALVADMDLFEERPSSVLKHFLGYMMLRLKP